MAKPSAISPTPLPASNAGTNAAAAQAPTPRRRILLVLLAGPAYPADLAETLVLGRTNISNHLACLRGCGLVRAEREGRQVRYELSSPRLAHALSDLVDLELEVEQHHLDLDGRV